MTACDTVGVLRQRLNSIQLLRTTRTDRVHDHASVCGEWMLVIITWRDFCGGKINCHLKYSRTLLGAFEEWMIAW